MRRTDWARVSEMVAERLALHFPSERLPDLQRGVAGAAVELCFADEAACAKRLLSGELTDVQINALASHLTVGETYFLRGHETFATLRDEVLPALIRARRSGEKRLRLWSAGCCTGEEAYSLAIVLRQILPDIDDWHVSILATDVNPRFLRKAAAGVYGEWSFRGTPAGFKERYFTRTREGHHAIDADIRRMVTFAPLNLAENIFPSLATATNAVDLILCRNVLMYFTAGQAERIVENLHGALREDGWLVVAPCEISQPLFSRFVTVGFDQAIFYGGQSVPDIGKRNTSGTYPSQAAIAPRVPIATGRTASAPIADGQTASAGQRARAAAANAVDVTRATVNASAGQGGHDDAVADQPPKVAADQADDPAALSLLAHALANQGRLTEALSWCERWIACDKLDAGAHYLRAMVLMEHGELDEARAALQRSIYLEPDTPMTSFALGNLERDLGRHVAAARHYRTTLGLLERQRPDEPLRYSEGITARQLGALVGDALSAEKFAA